MKLHEHCHPKIREAAETTKAYIVEFGVLKKLPRSIRQAQPTKLDYVEGEPLRNGCLHGLAYSARYPACGQSPLPDFVQQEFEAFLKCGRLEYGFLRVQCQSCKHEDLVAFSCKKRGYCPSCGAKRMVEHAALLVDEILPEAPYRQWVLSVPFQLRFLCFGSALNLNIHFHMLFLDGVYVSNKADKLSFKQVNGPTKDQLQTVVQRISERLAKLLTRQGVYAANHSSPNRR